jgi:hypothetical protein
MKFLVMVPASKESEAGTLPSSEALAKMGKYNEELVKAGVMLAAEGLHASSKGARIVFEKGKKSVVDGPFTESKELVAGFWLFQCKSKEEAIEWVKRAPFAELSDERVQIEIRQVFDPADFAPVDPTGELRAKEQELRERAARR